MDIDQKIVVIESNLERLLSFIRNIDNKCLLLLGINTAMLGIIANMASTIEDWTILSKLSTIITTVILLLSLISTFRGSYPQTESPPNSKISFEGITNMTANEYDNEIANLSKENYLHDLINQCYRNAEINVMKYKRLKAAYIFLSLGSISWIVSIYLFNAG